MQASPILSQLSYEEHEVKKIALIEFARPLFDRKSFYDIRMRDIASEVGVSSASIYRYFTTLDDFFVDALELDFINLDRKLDNLLARRAAIEGLCMAVLDYFIDNESAFQMICHFSVINGLSERIRQRFCDLYRRFLNMFDDKIERTGEGYDPGFSDAFAASLAGMILIFKNNHDLSREGRRRLIHRLGFFILHEEIISDSKADL